MKNKGFTIVEMLSAFILSSIIIIILFQLIINLKEIYQASGAKTDMLNKKNIIIDKIYTDLNEKKLVDFSNCGSGCIELIFANGETKSLRVSSGYQTIEYDDYKVAITNNFTLYDVVVRTFGNPYALNSDALLCIIIPITGKDNESYNISIVYPYISNEVNNHTTYVTNGLIAYLDGEKNIGTSYSASTSTWVDLSGNGNDAILHNNPSWQKDSLVFDGQTNYATIDNLANRTFPNGVTLQTEVSVISNIGATNSGTVEFMNNFHASGFGISYFSSSKYGASIHTNGSYQTALDTTTSTQDNYYTLALTYDNNSLKLYVNGHLKRTVAINSDTPITTAAVPFCIGCNPNTTGADTYSNVAVKNVLIYDRALSDEEVLQNYEAE